MIDGKSKIYGLVLSGGKSTRMGNDKGLIDYHGIPQREYLYNLLNKVCDKTFLSVRNEQKDNRVANFNCIVDEDNYHGPLNGILSAYAKYPNVAWLVLACDLPLINTESIVALISKRDATKVATSYATNVSKLPEPLVAIWEPNGLEKVIFYMNTAKSSCPRKFLINSDVKLVYPEKDYILHNANSIEEYEFALAKIN